MPIQSTCPRCGAAIGAFAKHCQPCHHDVLRERSRRTVLARIWAKVDRLGPIPPHRPELGSCWVFTANRNERGYGQITVNGVVMLVHRVTWASVNGPIPDGLVVDHLCRNPSCARPTHLEAVTPSENVRRAVPWRLQTRLNICMRGHSLTPENTIVEKTGHRRCRQCRQASERARARRRTQRRMPRAVARGERVGTSKLTEQEVREILTAYAAGIHTQRALAHAYHVTQACISLIVRRTQWRHVE